MKIRNAAAETALLAKMRTSSEASIWEHLGELRQTLISSLIALALAVGLCLFFYQEIFAWVTQPLFKKEQLQRVELKRERLFNSGSIDLQYTAHSEHSVHPSRAVHFDGEKSYTLPPGSYIDIESPLKNPLLLFSPTEGMLTTFKVCFWLGLLISSPFWGSFILRFILPALYPHEKRLIILFLAGTIGALCAGFCVAYYITIPLANQYLESFNANIGRNFWSLSHYLDYTLMLMIANGFAFEIGLGLFFLVHMGILTAEWMQAKRRHMIVLAFILGALLTPPDVPTQLMLAFPLIGLYELAVLYARLRRDKAR